MVKGIDEICKKCGKHLNRNTGSLTQWVFSKELCDCQEEIAQDPAVSLSQTQMDTGSEIPLASKEHSRLAPGTVIARNYEVISCLGEGGTSLVYKAKHQFMERIAAVKVLSPDRIPDARTVQRFQQEARSVSRLKHPNIVDIHEFGIDDNKQPYLVMDFLDGSSLFETLENDGPIKPSRAAGLFVQMADALQHAHEKSVIHRDLKPTNAILVKDESGCDQVKLVDFGIAKLNEADDKDKALTRTGEIFGSPFYMSPEQCKGLKLDNRSDIYSFGCLMYELIIGEPAAKSSSVVETLMLHINGLTLDFDKQTVVQKYAQLASESDTFEAGHEQKSMEKLRQIIQNCIKKEPEDRYKSMADVKRDLERILRGNQIFGKNENNIAVPALANAAFRADRQKSSLLESLPLLVAGCGALIVLGTVLIQFDVFKTDAKKSEEKSHEATAAPMPKTATHVLAATLPDGGTDAIDSLTSESAKKLAADRVTTIRMRNTQVSDSDLELLSQIPSLETIDITGSSGFQQSSIGYLAKLPKLNALTLAGTDVSDKSARTLVEMPLEKLDLSYTLFTEKGIDVLLNSKTLKHIKPLKTLNPQVVATVMRQHGWKPALRDWWEK